MLNRTEVHAVADNTASDTTDTYAAAFKMAAVDDTACACNTETGPMAAAATAVVSIITATWNGV